MSGASGSSQSLHKRAARFWLQAEFTFARTEDVWAALCKSDWILG
jgi:hypothetical protein